MFDYFKDPTPKRFITEKLGYPLEKHKYTTEDGHINTVFRIPGKKNTRPGVTKDPSRRVAIYQHGVLDCFIGIIAAGEDSLGLKLVNQGYDLWMNNSRGNRYSRDHQHIDMKYATTEEHAKFYNYSFEELAEYDQPALWKYVLETTGAEKLTYIGHSQGTSQMFAALSGDKSDWF